MLKHLAWSEEQIVYFVPVFVDGFNTSTNSNKIVWALLVLKNRTWNIELSNQTHAIEKLKKLSQEIGTKDHQQRVLC